MADAPAASAARRPMRRAPGARRLAWITACLLGAALPAQAQFVVPAGTSIDLGGGSVDLACTDLLVDGTLVLGAGGSLTGVRDVRIGAGGSLQLAGGSLQLAQQWVSQGAFSAGGGQVVRAAGPACPALGPLGPFDPLAPANTVPVPASSPAALGLLAALLAAFGGWRARRSARALRRQPAFPPR